MKKIFTLSLVAALALSATAANKAGVLTATRNQQMPTEAVKMSVTPVQAGELKSAPVKASQTSLKKARLLAETTEAGPYFEKPLGTFYLGYSADFYGFTKAMFLFSPAFTDIPLKAVTPGTPAWTFVDPNNMVESSSSNYNYEYNGTSSDEVLTLNYGADFYVDGPQLQYGDSIFQPVYYVNQGGPASYTNTTYNRKYLASNNDFGTDGPYWNLSYIGVNNTDANSFYSRGLAQYGVDSAYVKGIAEYLPYGGTPYMLNGVNAVVYCPTTGGNVTLTVYKATAKEDGSFDTITDEVLTTATISLATDDNYYQMLEFSDLLYEDPESGLEETLMIDGPIVVLIESDEAEFCSPFFLHPDEFEIDNHALQYVAYDLNGQTYADYFDANASWNGGYQSAWNMHYDINFYYLHNNEDTDTFNAPAEGGEKTFNVSSYYASGAWDITTPDFDDVPDWITVETGDETYESNGNTYFTGESQIKLTVEALPEGVESRTADILFSYDGAKLILHVAQPGDQGGLVGDVNGDGAVNGADVTALYNYILNGDTTFLSTSDVNGDGAINGGDVTAVYNIILGL